jgi:integrase
VRRGYQKGSLKVFRGKWVAQWWEGSHRRNRVIGCAKKMSKSQARVKLADVVAAVNNAEEFRIENLTVRDFVEQTFLPFYRRKWKPSTVMTNEDRFKNHIIADFGGSLIRTLGRDDLQAMLDRKAADGFSYSLVAHLRWDLKQIYNLAFSEGLVSRNPATILFVPRGVPRPSHRVMNFEEVKRLFGLLEQRERLISMLAILVGMRPGEIFGLKWGKLEGKSADIHQRVYRGQLDSPKTHHSLRQVALPKGLIGEIEAWRRRSLDARPGAWVFPSETGKTPITKDNCWRRHIAPKLVPEGLGWVNFQVMRRTHSTLMSFLKVDPKLVADQMGHTLDVNQNIYTLAPLERRLEAVNLLESAVTST